MFEVELTCVHVFVNTVCLGLRGGDFWWMFVAGVYSCVHGSLRS